MNSRRTLRSLLLLIGGVLLLVTGVERGGWVEWTGLFHRLWLAAMIPAWPSWQITLQLGAGILLVIAVLAPALQSKIRKAKGSSAPVRMQPISTGLVVFAAVLIASFTWAVTAWLYRIASTPLNPGGLPSPASRIDAIRTGLAAGASLGGAIALLLAFRRQRSTEITSAHDMSDATERRITELYTKAADLLGSVNAPVRLAGLYALERIAQSNPTQRQTIVNVICAYLRMPRDSIGEMNYGNDAGSAQGVPSPDSEHKSPEHPVSGRPISASDEPLLTQQEREVRLTAQRILRNHLLRGTTSTTFWPDVRLDLTGATLVDADFKECVISDCIFAKVRFNGMANFRSTIFVGDRTDFSGAQFNDLADFYHAYFFGTDTSFSHAKFLNEANFMWTEIDGDADFKGVEFTVHANFERAQITGHANFEGVKLPWSSFMGGKLGNVTFRNAQFGFINNEYCGFNDAEFSGTVFSEAHFHGQAHFHDCKFRDTSFYETRFSKGALFPNAEFRGGTFDYARFEEVGSFFGAEFRGDTSFKSVSNVELTGARARPSESQVWPNGWTTETAKRGWIKRRWVNLVPTV